MKKADKDGHFWEEMPRKKCRLEIEINADSESDATDSLEKIWIEFEDNVMQNWSSKI